MFRCCYGIYFINQNINFSSHSSHVYNNLKLILNLKLAQMLNTAIRAQYRMQKKSFKILGYIENNTERNTRLPGNVTVHIWAHIGSLKCTPYVPIWENMGTYGPKLENMGPYGYIWSTFFSIWTFPSPGPAILTACLCFYDFLNDFVK